MASWMVHLRVAAATKRRLSLQRNKLFYKGFSTSEIKEFEEYLKRILQNCKEAEAEK